MKKLIKLFFLFSFLVYQGSVFAALDMELTKGIDGTIPIAIVPFAWESSGSRPPEEVSNVITQDLGNSGRFNVLNKTSIQHEPHRAREVDYQYWIDKNVEDVVVGRVQPMGGNQYRVSFELVNLFKGSYQPNPTATNESKSPVLVTQEFTVDAKNLRKVAHHISDIIYEQLTGDKGVFSTRLAYVLAQHNSSRGDPSYFLEFSDMDGYNAIPILRSNEPIMSPSWSPDGKRIAYVSFEGKRPKIYVSEVATGRRELITSFPGINGAPSWSPDGAKLAVALSKGGNPNIYILDLYSKKMTQLTNDLAINTEPSWSPDGQSVIFTSDRGGSPQIYKLNLANNKTDRLTFDGNYNATASYTPDGKSIVVLHRDDDRSFSIAIVDLQSSRLRTLTTSGNHESPSVAPNGKMIVFSSSTGGRGVLGMVSSDGRVRIRLPDQQGGVQEPVWSPFLS